MASGSSGRGNGGSKGFDFGSDDSILRSYEDYANQDSSNGNHTDPTKEFHKSRMTARTSIFPATAYNSPEDSLGQEVIATVENSMKKFSDNIMRFLEGISSRLSQLELYCYNLDKSIGEMRSDLNRDHGEADSKLKFLEKHIQEVHRSVQILRDKQELAETQEELAKHQLVQKESSSSSHSQSNEERSASASDPKKTDNASDPQSQQLALALPHQVAPQQQPAALPSQAPALNASQATQQPPYYMPPTPLPNPPAVAQLPQNQYLSDPQNQYVASQPISSRVTQPPPVQHFSQYQLPHQQQQWPQQVQPPEMQSQVRPPSPPSATVYPQYPPNQAINPSPTEMPPNSMPMQMPYSGIPPPGTSCADAIPYGYGGSGRPVQQPPPQQFKGSFPAQPGDAYGTSGTHATPPPASSYIMYDGEGGRTHHPLQPPPFAQAGYPPPSASIQNHAPHNLVVRNPNQSQFIRSHPYNELIEKLMSMGFRGDHVASVIQRMEESGQPMDFNSVLDRLNVHNSVGPQRGWSG